MATIDDLAESLASQLPLTKAEAFRGARAVVAALMESLLKGEVVNIAGVGRFTCSKIHERPDRQMAALRFSGRPPPSTGACRIRTRKKVSLSRPSIFI